MELPSRRSETSNFGKAPAYRPREAAFYGRLKEATLDLGAAHIDSLRAIFTSRVLQTRARLHGLTISNTQSLDTKHHQSGLRGNVLALGLGLLERTEAVLDLLLQLADTENQDNHEAVKEVQHGDDRPFGFLDVPRVISSQVLQTFAMPLSTSHTVRVTFVGVQDTCVSLMHVLRIQELWELLRGLHSWAQEKQKELTDDTEGTPAVAVRAANIARKGCEKLLGDRFERLLNSGIVVRLLGRGPEEAHEHELEQGQATTVSIEEILEGHTPESLSQLNLGELQSGRGRCIHLVVRNSFFELVEEESPRELRRAQSCDAVLTAAGILSPQADAASETDDVPGAAGGHAPAELAVGDVPSGFLRHPSSSSTAQPAEAVGNATALEELAGDVGDDDNGDICDDAERMTVMLRNVPQQFTRNNILELLDWAGFRGRYDFVYLPVDFTRGRSLGYALVGLVSHEAAEELLEKIQGCCFPGEDPSIQCEASWSQPHRGLSGHIERYRNSPVMHPSMPDEYKPVIFADGQRITFPAPTKTIRAPRIRHPKARRGPSGRS
ncbi:unnamed protein product [Effrenium voratum]|nr:unnamed protein product [Effrenium voratum]|mmetsp:Transcript_97810/g.232900  ORF Transcript_97810/g.232900 Transcript_97810/m.232900 type:complete len:552 (-) Transcript_97810:146-1801(-)